MAGNLHEYTMQDNKSRQEEDQVVPDIDLSQNDDNTVLSKHVRMCNKVGEFLKKEILSNQCILDPFHIAYYCVQRGDSFDSLRISMEIEDRPVNKSTLEIIGLVLNYSSTQLGIDRRSIQKADAGESKLLFKFTGLIMPVELKLASSNNRLSLLGN